MAKNTSKKKPRDRKVFGIQGRLLALICPLFIVSLMVLTGVSMISTKNTLVKDAQLTLRQEALSTIQGVTIDIVTATSAPTINASYVKILTRPNSLWAIYSEIESLSIIDCGYAFLVSTETGKVLAHQDSSLEGITVSETEPGTFLNDVSLLIDNSLEAETLPIELLHDGTETCYVIAQPFTDIPWVMVTCLPERYISEQLVPLYLNSIISAAALLIIVTVMVGVAVHRMISPVRKLTGVLTQVADGDFTVNIKPRGNDEITVMSRALQDYVVVMRDVIQDIRDVSSLLNNASDSSKQISSNLLEVAETQADSMGEMQVTLDQTASAILMLAQHSETLTEVVNTTNENGKTASAKMKETVNVATSGRADMEQVSSRMSTIVDSMKQLEDTVKEVGESTKQINAAVQLISEIADQTNLLSLNASIEAARAGDAGKGFAVVAEEIGKLAEVSASSATKITDIIEKVSTQVNDMVTRTTESVTYIEDSSGTITTSCDVFEQIYENVSETNSVLQNIVDQIHQVDDVARQIADLSQEQSSNTDEILASTQVLADQSLMVSDRSKSVADSAKSVSDASFTLSEHMRRFKVSDGE